MIPHAVAAFAGSVGALMVAVIGPAFVAGPVLSPCLAGRPPAALAPTPFAAVDVPVVAATVDPELLAAAPAIS
jgi:hypothetical protein